MKIFSEDDLSEIDLVMKSFDKLIPLDAVFDDRFVRRARHKAWPLEKLGMIFEPSSEERREAYLGYVTKLTCELCCREYDMVLSKSRLLEIIVKNYICESCRKVAEGIAERDRLESSKEYKREQQLKTIDLLLSTDRLCNTLEHVVPWLSENMPDEVWREVAEPIIASMSYRDFLITPYWKGIALYIKRLAGFSCQICCSPKGLSTHHRNYRHHGREHTHEGLADLVCLCDPCHKTHHKIPDPSILSGT